MKKLIFLSMLVASSAMGQQFKYQSFLNESALTITNTIQATNLASIGATTTNVVGLIITNFQGTRVIAAAGDTHNAFLDVQLWGERNSGTPPFYFATGTNVLQNWIPSPQSVYVKLVGQSGANSAVTFVIYPIVEDISLTVGGTNSIIAGIKEINAAANTWTFAVTANTTTPVTLITNVPANLFIGAKGLRMNRIVNGDTDATSNVTIQDCALVGFMP